MKKAFAYILALLLLLSMTACRSLVMAIMSIQIPMNQRRTSTKTRMTASPLTLWQTSQKRKNPHLPTWR